jgi:hypothetical protein
MPRDRSKPIARSARDVFISGLDRVESAGPGVVRYVLYVLRRDEHGVEFRCPTEFNILAPEAAMPDAVGKMIASLGRQVIVAGDGTLTVKH